MAALPVLYKQPEAWNLPSSSAASIQVEAYLRFTAQPFHLQECTSDFKSPSGQMPALEQEMHFAGLEDVPEAGGSGSGAPTPRQQQRGVLAEFPAARTCMRFAARHVCDIDAHLSSAQRAELLAYSVMLETRVEPAVVFASWCEPTGFAAMRQVIGKLPFPLSYIIPYGHQRQVRAHFSHIDSEVLYADAVSAIAAIGDRLAASPGPFFFGAKPTSVDALLAGLLVFLQLSPAAPPVLHARVGSSPRLCSFVELVLRDYFSVPVSRPPAPADGASWSDAAKGHKKAKEPRSEPTAAERQFRRNSRLWLLGCGAAIVMYVLLSGQYIKVDFHPGDLFDDDDDDDGGDAEE